MSVWHEIVGVIGLGILGVVDIRKHELPGLWIGFFFVVGAIFSLVEGIWCDWKVVLGFLPGFISLLLSRISKEEVGYGDGLVLVALASYGSWEWVLESYFYALLFAGVVALFVLVILRKGVKTELPFVPFLFLGYGLSVIGGQG